MYRSFLLLETAPENLPRVVERYAELQVFEQAILHSGALSCEIASASDGSGTLIVLTLWPTADAYRNWLDHPARAEVGELLADLVSVTTGRVFKIETQLRAPDGRDSAGR